MSDYELNFTGETSTSGERQVIVKVEGKPLIAGWLYEDEDGKPTISVYPKEERDRWKLYFGGNA